MLLVACTSGSVGIGTATPATVSSVPDDVTAQVVLPPDVEALKSIFNQDAGRTRLLLLMAPT